MKFMHSDEYVVPRFLKYYGFVVLAAMVMYATMDLTSGSDNKSPRPA